MSALQEATERTRPGVLGVADGDEDGLLDELVVQEGRCERAQAALGLEGIAASDVLQQHHTHALAGRRKRQRRVCAAGRES